jgi:hypothetical protein
MPMLIFLSAKKMNVPSTMTTNWMTTDGQV